MKKNVCRENRERAFTIVEIMVVLAVISILAVLTLANVRKNRLRALDRAHVSDIKIMRLALEEYRARCGQYPPKFSLDAHNSSGTCSSVTGPVLGDFIRQIPSPKRSVPSRAVSNGIVDQEAVIEGTNNSYFYVGLSSAPGGKCYDYHIAAELEQEDSPYLREDHDFGDHAGKYRYQCENSADDFEADRDSSHMLYDFRSSKTNI